MSFPPPLRRCMESRRRIVLPEGLEARVLQAAEQITRRDLADVVLLGGEEDIKVQICHPCSETRHLIHHARGHADVVLLGGMEDIKVQRNESSAGLLLHASHSGLAGVALLGGEGNVKALLSCPFHLFQRTLWPHFTHVNAHRTLLWPQAEADKLGVDISRCTIEDPATSPRQQKYVDLLCEARKHKVREPNPAQSLGSDFFEYATSRNCRSV